MSKLYCEDCRCIVDDISKWTEKHHPGEPHTYEPMSGCKCGNGLIEVEPCAICGEYPVDEYEEGELSHGGICAGCFADGIEKYFMEYLDTLDRDEQMEFYCGKVDGGYIYDSYDIYLMMKDDYAERVKFHRRIFGAEYEAKRWTSFISDGDSVAFGEWLIEKAEAAKNGIAKAV